MKKNIIMVIIILICSASLLLVLYYFSSKDIYYISENINNKNIELSMIKIENGSTTTITETPTEGIYTIDYNCDGTANITWINMTHKLKVKVTNTPLKCTIEFRKVPDKDINIVAIYVDNVQQASNFTFASNTNYYLTEYECYNIDGTENTEVGVSWDKKSKTIAVSSFNKQTYCDVHFKTTGITFYDEIINSEIAQSDYGIDVMSCNSNGYCGPSAASSYVKNTNGLFYTSDLSFGESGERIYYYRGSMDNNWVLLGGNLWRIVRTTYNKGIKLVYSGPSNNMTSTSALIGTSAYNTYQCTTYENCKYSVGYTYNSNLNAWPNSSNNHDSTLKSYIDNWYESWVSSNSTIPNYLDNDAVYCNYLATHADTSTIVRFTMNKSGASTYLAYSCDSAANNDVGNYSVNNTDYGNGLLKYPIATLNRNEIIRTGVTIDALSSISALSNTYLLDNMKPEYEIMVQLTDVHWSVPPQSSMYSSYPASRYNVKFIIKENKILISGAVNQLNSALYVRPAIALKPCVTLSSGTGTYLDPYTISYGSCS